MTPSRWAEVWLEVAARAVWVAFVFFCVWMVVTLFSGCATTAGWKCDLEGWQQGQRICLATLERLRGVTPPEPTPAPVASPPSPADVAAAPPIATPAAVTAGCEQVDEWQACVTWEVEQKRNLGGYVIQLLLALAKFAASIA